MDRRPFPDFGHHYGERLYRILQRVARPNRRRRSRFRFTPSRKNKRGACKSPNSIGITARQKVTKTSGTGEVATRPAGTVSAKRTCTLHGVGGYDQSMTTTARQRTAGTVSGIATSAPTPASMPRHCPAPSLCFYGGASRTPRTTHESQSLISHLEATQWFPTQRRTPHSHALIDENTHTH